MKRTPREIMLDLLTVECRLSPENLCCDGEASAAYVKREYAKLSKQKTKLVEELGYEPSWDQLMEARR